MDWLTAPLVAFPVFCHAFTTATLRQTKPFLRQDWLRIRPLFGNVFVKLTHKDCIFEATHYEIAGFKNADTNWKVEKLRTFEKLLNNKTF